MPSIDLNCDLGESFGAYTIGMDAEILPYVTSANIACGFHAGDPSVMQKSVLLCKKYGVKVGPCWWPISTSGSRAGSLRR